MFSVLLPVVVIVVVVVVDEVLVGDEPFAVALVCVLDITIGATELELLLLPPMTPRPKRRAKVMAASPSSAARAQHQDWQQPFFSGGSSSAPNFLLG